MATQTVYSNGTDEGSIKIDVPDHGSIYFARRESAVWESQFYVYASVYDGRMAVVYLDSEKYQTHTINSWKFTPVSNSTDGDIITTVLSAGTTGVTLTQTAQVFPDEKYVKYTWSLYNGGVDTYSNVKLYSFVWQSFQGDGYWYEGWGWSEADKLLYISRGYKAIMGMYSTGTPPDEYFSGEYSLTKDFVLTDAELPNLSIGQETSAFGWVTSNFGPGETWNVEAYEMCYFDADDYSDQPSNRRTDIYPSMYYPDPSYPGSPGGPTYRRFYGHTTNGPWPDPRIREYDTKVGTLTARYDYGTGFTSGSWENLYSGSTISLAQSFSVASSSKLWFVVVAARKAGTWSTAYPDVYWDPYKCEHLTWSYQNLPSNQKYRAKIYSHTGTFGSTGVPDTLLATSNEYCILVGQGGPQWTKYFFFEGSEAITLTPGNYFVAIEFTEGDAAKYLQVYVDATSPSHSGNYASLVGSTWTPNASKDMFFQIITDDNQLWFDSGDPLYDAWQEGDGYYYKGDGFVARGETLTFSPSGATGIYGPTLYNSWSLTSGGLYPYYPLKTMYITVTSGTPAAGDTITGDITGAQVVISSGGSSDSPFNPTYQDGQYPWYSNWPDIDYGNVKAIGTTDPLNTYLEFDEDDPGDGLPDYFLGSSVWENYGEIEFIVLPWDANTRRAFLYGEPPDVNEKIYYSVDSLWDSMGTNFVWYVESAGSGRIPYIIDATNPHTTWIDSYFFSWPSIIYPAKSIITEVGEDSHGFWFKMRPMTITDPYSACPYNHAARDWNQANVVAYKNYPIGRAANYSAEDGYIIIFPKAQVDSNIYQGRIIW